MVLLHDAGGDRAETVAALPLIIDELRRRGYEVVPVCELAGMTRDEAMPLSVTGTISSFIDRTCSLGFDGADGPLAPCSSSRCCWVRRG